MKNFLNFRFFILKIIITISALIYAENTMAIEQISLNEDWQFRQTIA